MQVFVFDWTAYAENVDKFRVEGELPCLVKEHFDIVLVFKDDITLAVQITFNPEFIVGATRSEPGKFLGPYDPVYFQGS